MTPNARLSFQSSGGLPHVRAIALALEADDMVQVSMNLTDYTQTGLATVLDAVRSRAAARRVTVARTQLVGPVPLQAIADAFKQCIQAVDFSAEQIIENALLDQRSTD